MSALGLHDGDDLVVYDGSGTNISAARAWWTFRVFGHRAWRCSMAGCPSGGARAGRSSRARCAFRPAASRPHSTAPRSGTSPRCARSWPSPPSRSWTCARRDGSPATEPEPRAGLRGGHIPGSRNLPFNELVAADGTLLPADALRRRLAAAGIDASRPVVATCGSGTSACTLILALHLLGHDQVALYDGSWAEWGGRGRHARRHRGVSDAPVGRPAAASVRTAVGCVVLFLLPFAAVGVGTAVAAVRAAAMRDWGQAGFLSIFALTFGGVGIGGIVTVLRGRRRAEAALALEARHPEAPWLWREDWAARRITDASVVEMGFAWAFAILWNLISIPGAVLAVRAALREGNRAALIALLFPAVGVGLAGLGGPGHDPPPALRGVGARAGHAARGRGPRARGDAAHARRAPAARGFPGSAELHPAGHERQRATTGPPRRGFCGRRSGAPVRAAPASRSRSRFPPTPRRAIRAGATIGPSGGSRSPPRCRASTTRRGSRCRSSVRPRARCRAPRPSRRSPPESAVPADYRQPAGSRILVSRTRRGTEIYFPRARNPGMAASLTVFTLIWAAAIWATIAFDAPVIFPIVFGAFGVLLLFLVIDQWIGVARVTADRDGGDHREGLAGGRPGANAACGRRGGGDDQDRQPGRAHGVLRRDHRDDGRQAGDGGRGYPGQAEAEWLAAAVQAALRTG